MRKIERISISPADRERMERLVRDRNTPQKVVWRARIVLLAGEGLTATAIAAGVSKSVLTVRRWRRRYLAEGVDGLLRDADDAAMSSSRMSVVARLPWCAMLNWRLHRLVSPVPMLQRAPVVAGVKYYRRG
jgi:hypothetical protein